MSGQSEIDAVRDATDLVRLIGEQIALRPKGREHVGLCPFHDDKNPSMAVVTHKGNAFYKCHACGAGGDAFDFVMNYHRMDFGEALRLLADRAGITLQPRARSTREQGEGGGSKRADLKKANAFAAAFFQRMLTDPSAGSAARDMIAQRGISDEMVQIFMIGAAPDQWDALSNRIRKQSLDERIFLAAGLLKPRKEGEGAYDAFRNRLIFPICDELGAPIAFGARKIDPQDEPKYLNSAESPLFSKSKTLYGLHQAKRSIIESRQAIVTEGYTDVIACHQAGITNVVATLGTALTREHAQLLGRLCDSVVLLFDGDEAGQKAADRALEVFFSSTVDVKICVLPDDLDPDELLKAAGGRERFDASIAESIDALQYKLNRFQAQLGAAGGLSSRQKRLEGFLTELSNLGFASMQGVRRSFVLTQLSQMLGVSVAAIESAMPKARRAVPAAEAPDAAATEVEDTSSSPARRRAERDLLSMIIHQPDLRTVAGPMHAADFSDPLCALIAGAMDALPASAGFTVQQLLAQLEQPEAKSLATNLYFEGERLCEQAADARELCQAAAASLRAHINLEEYAQTVTTYRACRDAPQEALLAANAVIEKRRRQENIAWAIAQGVRS